MLKKHIILGRWNIAIYSSRKFTKYELWFVWYKELSIIKLHLSYIHINVWKDKNK